MINNLLNVYSLKKFEIQKRLKEFESNSDNFYELCFCLLTPQSKAVSADIAVQKLKKLDFKNKDIDPKQILKENIRFHNNKSKYLLEFKENHKNIFQELNKLNTPSKKREFLVNNVKGLGLKEASHFLRNTGHKNLAILDRHILKNLVKYNVIDSIPKTLTKKSYLNIEKKFQKFSEKINISLDELDLLFWYLQTKNIFK